MCFKAGVMGTAGCYLLSNTNQDHCSLPQYICVSLPLVFAEVKRSDMTEK